MVTAYGNWWPRKNAMKLPECWLFLPLPITPIFFATTLHPTSLKMSASTHTIFFATPNCFGCFQNFLLPLKILAVPKKVAAMPSNFYCSQKVLPQPSPTTNKQHSSTVTLLQTLKMGLLGYFGTAVGRSQQQGFTSTKKCLVSPALLYVLMLIHL